jgi:D-arabinose 1-dehydrogenase-like Zn-dependent alcohol dehydrogenase
MMAKWAKARVIAVDVARAKLDACLKAGADAVIDASACDPAKALRDLTHGEGVDVAIDYVSATATLEAGVKALGRRGRLVTLGGAGKNFQASSLEIMLGEQDLLGSRYVTRTDILETLDIVARGEVWPLVSDIRPLAQAEALHERLERGEITGRAALLVIEMKT